MPSNFCIDCKTPIQSSGIRRCYTCAGLARRKLPHVCRSCGTATAPGFDRCRACYGRARINPAASMICPKCSGKKSRYSATCLTCRNLGRVVIKICSDCGANLPKQSRSGRCMKCAMAQRTIRMHGRPAPESCTVVGCTRPFFALGVCHQHYINLRRAGNLRSIANRVRALPCGLCGYHKLPSNAHRLDGLVGYIYGNMVPLCLNCHREVHAGIATPPDPYTIFTIALV